MAESWFALFTLANLGGHNVIEISSIEFAEKIGASQQTASRRLKELEKRGYISRTITHKGQSIRITPKGLELLHKIHLLLTNIFTKEPREMSIEGEVFSGMGEGAYYINQKGYFTQFKEKLGFSPYPGTLNIRLRRQPDLQIRKVLESNSYPGIIIDAFKDEERTFGAVKCFKVKIDNIEGAILLIHRTHHTDNVLEIISSEFLRKRLSLRDGDKVRVVVELTQN